MRRFGGDRRGSAWCYASLEDVAENLRSTGYPELANALRPRASRGDDSGDVARRDLWYCVSTTDGMSSTRHELEHLMPLLRPGGVLILDDYGHWQGARQAVDEYLEA